MRVTEQDDALILRTSWSSIFGQFLLGLFFLAMGCGMIWFLGREATLTCKRLEADQVQCQIQQIWFSHVVQQVTVNNPQKAIVQTQHSSKGGTSYRMALVTEQGTIPMTDVYSSDADAAGLAAEFNQFVASPSSTSISLDQPASGFVFIFLVMFGGFGFLMMLTTHSNTYTFDRYRNTLTISRLGVTGRREREEETTGLTANVRQFRGSKGHRYYCVFVHLNNGRDLKIEWNASRQSAAQSLADRIQEFMRPGVHIQYATA